MFSLIIQKNRENILRQEAFDFATISIVLFETNMIDKRIKKKRNDSCIYDLKTS